MKKITNKKRLLFFSSIILAALITCSIATYQFIFKPTTQIASRISKQPEIVKGKVITLRQLKEEYFIDFHNMFSNIVRKSLEFPEHITLEYTINYLKGKMNKIKAKTTVNYCIFDNKENKLIGAIEIRDKNNVDPGQVGCWLNENYWGGGRVQEALNLISQVYFALKGATSYNAHVRLWNKRSYQAFKKFGFEDKEFYYEDGKPTRYIIEYSSKR